MNKNVEEQIPRVDLKPAPEAQNEPDEKHTIPLDGKWILHSDPILIGKNFRTMTNMRYALGHPEGVLGMAKVNTAIINATYYKTRSATQFIKAQPYETHILAQSYNSGLTKSVVLNNKTTIPGSSDFVFNTNNGTSEATVASRSTVVTSPPATFTLEIKTLFPALGTLANVDYAYLSYVTASGTGAWRLGVIFASDGLYIQKASAATTEVGSDIVKCNATAVWQTWRFQVNKTTVSTATVQVFLEGNSQGTVDCNYETGGTAGTLTFTQNGAVTNFMSSQISSIKIATSLGVII